MVLRRTLDWPAHGLGRNTVVARRDGPAGPWLDITWPGFVGVFTALAPGRFAAAINQAPLRRRTGLMPADWLIDRVKVGRSTDLPPCHLLREVFETCRDYAEARNLLTTAPICLPALFILAGALSGEGCIIERTEDAAAIVDAPAAIANGWLTPAFGRGTARGYDSPTRQCLLAACQAGPCDDLEWLQPPIVNPYTRLAAVLDAGRRPPHPAGLGARPALPRRSCILRPRTEALRAFSRVSDVSNPCKVISLKSLVYFLMHGVVLQNRMLRAARPLTTQRSPL